MPWWKWIAHGVVGMAALALPSVAQAQTYPSKNVRVIVPFGAGGPTDVIARLVAQKLSESWGHQFYVENLPGAGGNTGTAQAARAPADGYTLVAVSTGFMVNPSLYTRVPYDPVKEFEPVTLVAASPNVIFMHPSFPAKSLKDMIAVVKANPGKYSYAQPSLGSTPHLSAEQLKLTFDLDLQMVPFTSAALAVNSTLAGHTPIGFTAIPPTVGLIKEGKLRGLAVAAHKRVEALPELPTTAEAGVPDQEADTLTGIVAPAGTPQELVARLQQEIAKIVAQPEVKNKLTAIGFRPIANTPAEFGALIKSEMERWGKVVRAAKLKIE
jgi:tripartite-type tricarboxylate transporter receptor subunit TctC